MLKKLEESGNGKLEDKINHEDDGETEGRERNVNNNRGNIPVGGEDRQDLVRVMCRLREEGDALRRELEYFKRKAEEMRVIREDEILGKNRLYNELLAVKEALEAEKREIILREKYLKEKKEARLKKLSGIKRKKDSHSLSQVTKDFDQGVSTSKNLIPNSENEARLLSLISLLLHFLPFGAKANYICAYLNQADPTLTTEDVKNFMKRYPSIFKQVTFGTDDALTDNWTLMLFKK